MSSKLRFLGRTSRLYIGDKWETTVWARIDTRDTLAVNFGKNLEDVTAEDSDGEQWQQAVSNTRAVEFTMFYGKDGMGAEEYAKLESAFENDLPLPFAISDGDITAPGMKYRKLDLYVTTFNDQRDARGVGKVSISLSQGPTVNKRTTITVAGGG